MHGHGRIVASAVILACSVLPARADASALADDLARSWKAKIVTLRVPVQSNHIVFNNRGETTGSATPGIWSTDSMFQVDSVRMSDRVLRIEGKRVAVYLDPNQGKFVRTLTGKKIRIDLQVAAPNATLEDLNRALVRIFMNSSENLGDLVPYYWKTCFSGGIFRDKDRWVCRDQAERRDATITSLPQDQARDFTGLGIVYKVGPDVTAPRALSTPDPNYTEMAKKARLTGTTVLSLVVGSDGKPNNIRVVSPLGLGLDDEAVRTVEAWKFKPATKDGVPVAVQINVEMNFRLY